MTPRTRVLICWTVLLFGLIASVVRAQTDAARNSAPTWDAVASILARIKAPEFPNKDFDVTAYGAVADGTTDNTAAIAKAIDACQAAGGGRVVIASGTVLTGAVHLKSNVNLHIARGATLKFSPDPAKYLPVVLTRFEGTECMNYSSLVYAFEQENIAITGEGTLDGSASEENWWGWAIRRPVTPANTDSPAKSSSTAAAPTAPGKSGSGGTKGGKSIASTTIAKLVDMADRGVPVEQRVFGAEGKLRPNFVTLYRCKNILIEGVHIINSPMWELHPTLSSNITVRGVEIRSHGPNNDGCDPDSCRDVLIENCVFDTGDDCIAIKSGRNDDGRRVNAASENMIIRNCTMKDGHGGVVIGSEISGGCRNVFVENCKMDSPELERVLRFKSNARRGGLVENVYVRNVQVGQVVEAILTVDFLYETGAVGDFKPIVRNVTLENVTSEASPRVLWISGIPQGTIDGITFKNCTFKGLTSAELVDHAGRIVFDGVTLVPAKKARSLSSREAITE